MACRICRGICKNIPQRECGSATKWQASANCLLLLFLNILHGICSIYHRLGCHHSYRRQRHALCQPASLHPNRAVNNPPPKRYLMEYTLDGKSWVAFDQNIQPDSRIGEDVKMDLPKAMEIRGFRWKCLKTGAEQLNDNPTKSPTCCSAVIS